jgi:hypothetical protein
MATAAVLAGAFFEVRPPDAYGICMVCHGRDLVNSVVNGVFGTSLLVAPAALVFPLLTTIGVVLGAGFAAVRSGEWSIRKARRPLRSFTHGFLVMNFGLVAAGCSTRLALRTAAGDPAGVLGFIAMAVGVVAATMLMRRRATR